MKNFVIVGTQRIGSTAIASALVNHPHVACGWEWTQRVARRDKIAVAENALAGKFSVLPEKHRTHMESVFSGDELWLGYRRLFRASSAWIFRPGWSAALWLDRLEDHLKWLAGRADIHVVHIQRDDNIAWLKSKYLARATKLYSGREYTAGIKVKIPIRTSLARLKSKEWVDGRLSTLRESNPYLQLVYEEFLAEPDHTTDKILEFLQLDPAMMPDIKKVNKRQSRGTPEDYIANYSQLVTALARHGFA